jgi:predicted TIM-barrel fold metal-dependent hydrolase
MLAYDFWCSDKLVFGAELPLGDFFWGGRNYRITISVINAMNIADEDKKKIFLDNALKLLRIPL